MSRSCPACTPVQASSERTRSGGASLEQCRFGGMAPEDFGWAFKFEGRTLKGNKAQGSIGPNGDGNVVIGQRTSRWSNALRSSRHPLETGEASNGEKATAVVTQCGYCEGKSFEGYDTRVWERHEGLMVAAMQREGDCAGNDPNPMAGSRVQQTYRAICGANRRSREERHGRKMCLTWRSDADCRSLHRDADMDRTRMVTKRRRGVLWKTTREEV